MPKIILYPVLFLLSCAALALLLTGGAGAWGGALGWFQDQQRLFHDNLATNLHAIHDSSAVWPWLMLVGIGFLYGILHAVGPGHGKLVVTSYLLADDATLRRGLIVVALASLLQSLVAITAVLIVYYALGLARAQAEQAGAWLEAVSFALIALVGLNLLRRGLRLLCPQHSVHHAHEHAHHDHTHQEHHHEHGHAHGADCGCGHNHMPEAGEIRHARGWPALLFMSLSIGIRPCSGAIILMLFACLIGAVLPGIIGTLMMGVGTAITTGALAYAAVRSKQWLLRRVEQSERQLGGVEGWIAVGGGTLLLAIGLLFCITTVQTELTAPVQSVGGLPLMHLPNQN